MSGAGSRGIRWSPRGPRLSPCRSGGRPRPSGGPMRSIAGNTARRPESLTVSDRRDRPMTRPPRRGPLCCGLCCVATGWSRCARTPTKPRAGSRRRTSRRQRPRSFKVSRGSSAVTSMPAMPTSRHAISIGDVGAPDALAHALCERSLVAMTRGHWNRAEALAVQARTVVGRAGSRTPTPCPGERGASPRRPAPRRRRGGAPGTGQCPAAAAVPDLRGAHHRRSGPDRAHPRAPGARRHGRGQDADAGSRGVARAAARPRHPGRRGRRCGPSWPSGVAPTRSGRRP